MAIDLVSRAEWGARPTRGSYGVVKSTKGVKVHYTGGRVDERTLDDHDRCAAAVRGIQAGHQAGNGWLDIGYTAVACAHRKVFVGRGLNRLPAANGEGLNSQHYAVLGLVGTSGVVTPPDGMLHGIRDAIEWLRAEGGAGPEIKGHRDGYATDCPGGPLYAWVEKGAPRPGGTVPAPPPAPAPAWPGRLLAYPPLVRGDDVRAWQAQMARRGWEVDVDGAYGLISRDLCLAFQREKGLTTDGIVGRATWDAAWAAPIT